MAVPASGTRECGSVHVLLTGSATRVVLAGPVRATLRRDLDVAAVEALASRLPVQVDARHVTDMDVTGVAFLARLAAHASAPLLVIRPPALVRFLLQATSVGDHVTVIDLDPLRTPVRPLPRPSRERADDHPPFGDDPDAA